MPWAFLKPLTVPVVSLICLSLAPNFLIELSKSSMAPSIVASPIFAPAAVTEASRIFAESSNELNPAVPAAATVSIETAAA